MKKHLSQEAIVEMLEDFKNRQGEARGRFAMALSSTWNMAGELRKSGMIERMDYADLLAEKAVSIHICLKALLNMDELTYSVIAGEVKDPIEVTPDHLLEANICYHVTLLTDLLEESRIAAAAGNLPICGAWTGWNTVVRVKDFFTWAEIEGYFVPEAIRNAIDGPELYAARRKAEGADNGQIVAEMKERFNLPPSRIGDILRPGDYAPDAQRMWANRELAKWEAERK